MFGYRESVERRKERELIQIELIQMETMTAKQIKNTFADVVEIGLSMSLYNKGNLLESYAGGIEFKEGKTENEVRVIFSDRTERKL